MTKAEAVIEFKMMYPRDLFVKQYSNGRKRVDDIARQQAWNFYIDDLHRNNEITDHQVNNWTNPF